MKPLRTKRLILRNWEERDRELFHEINSDPEVMRFFPMRRDRSAADAVMDRLQSEIERDGYGFAAVELAQTGECIGFVGIRKDPRILRVSPDATEIGWRLKRNLWGKGYATEAAREWLRFGFQDLSLEEIVSFAVANNTWSLAVMERIGMWHDQKGDFDHEDVPDTHPHLKRHALYRLSRADWKKKREAGA
ncbi:GNAT family N-acetyltransferase [Tianweitania populi]|uniref:N-acetyltransferase n=1 Tax=Tianweitania populi TaxID=1607949 RepID=A0A8J3GK22_9HYPH|nr:GNAT family N-acetyltransferase [Tianweitania populi]GHD10743.1 N-acetyltransferase [Tianweitania populi]